jgi:N-acyl-D-amino-acid deacylase
MDTILIRGAEVFDGTGEGASRVDVAVSGGRIAAVGRDLPGSAGETIDAGGLALAPGFIDIHSHTDLSVFARPLAESKVRQGVTTEVVGNCGIGAFPIRPERRDLLADSLRMHGALLPSGGVDWTDFSSYAARVAQGGLGVNLAPLVAHGSLRITAMGAEDRPPTAAELTEMEALLEVALLQGAWGMSTGLIYPPGSYATTTEIVALAGVLARHGVVYTSHIRGEGETLLAALAEAVQVGRESGARVQVSHLKALGRKNWGRGREALALLETARREGVDVAADQYPYEATSTALSALVPAWAHAGGVHALLERLAAPDLRDRLSAEIARAMEARGGADRVQVARVGSAGNAGFSGRTVQEIAGQWGIPPAAAVVRLLLEEKAEVGAVYFSLSPEDVAAIMVSDIVAVGSDGLALSAAEDRGQVPHPRSYGTFPRVLGQYVREQRLLSLPLAIHKMTGLPSSRLGLSDRGHIRPGYAADLVLFDPATVRDRADFQDPHQYATGIEYVVVNGRPVVRSGQLTGERPGQVLRRRLA